MTNNLQQSAQEANPLFVATSPGSQITSVATSIERGLYNS